MHHQFFGLTKDPFSMTPDPAFLFLTLPHREALAGVMYAVLHREGFVVLTGDAGTGKTTLLSRVLEYLPKSQVQFSMILNPTLTPAEFLEMALLDFGVTNIPASKTQRLILLQRFLLDTYRNQKIAVLIVDEAHKLPAEVLEEIRLLSNFELPEAKLLQIVLAGQTELGAVLNREDMRQLKQRITVRLTIPRLSQVGVEHYIKHRWETAGANGAPPFQAEALTRIAEYSRGIPRVINAVCGNALMVAYAENSKVVGAMHIDEVAGDLDLLGPTGKPVSAARDRRTGAPAQPALARWGFRGKQNGIPR
jgi:general secretion pathway protein A